MTEIIILFKKRDTYFGISGYSDLKKYNNQAGVDRLHNPTVIPNGEPKRFKGERNVVCASCSKFVCHVLQPLWLRNPEEKYGT